MDENDFNAVELVKQKEEQEPILINVASTPTLTFLICSISSAIFILSQIAFSSPNAQHNHFQFYSFAKSTTNFSSVQVEVSTEKLTKEMRLISMVGYIVENNQEPSIHHSSLNLSTESKFYEGGIDLYNLSQTNSILTNFTDSNVSSSFSIVPLSQIKFDSMTTKFSLMDLNHFKNTAGILVLTQVYNPAVENSLFLSRIVGAVFHLFATFTLFFGAPLFHNTKFFQILSWILDIIGLLSFDPIGLLLPSNLNQYSGIFDQFFSSSYSLFLKFYILSNIFYIAQEFSPHRAYYILVGIFCIVYFLFESTTVYFLQKRCFLSPFDKLNPVVHKYNEEFDITFTRKPYKLVRLSSESGLIICQIIYLIMVIVFASLAYKYASESNSPRFLLLVISGIFILIPDALQLFVPLEFLRYHIWQVLMDAVVGVSILFLMKPAPGSDYDQVNFQNPDSGLQETIVEVNDEVKLEDEEENQ